MVCMNYAHNKKFGLLKFHSGYGKCYFNSPKGYRWKIVNAQTGSGNATACSLIQCYRLPQAFDNEKHETHGNLYPYQYNQVISPVCNTRFYLEHGTERRCVGVNTWSKVDPSCSPVTCILPKAFVNGKYNSSRDKYPYGSKLVPLCDKGHYLVSNVTERVCNDKDVWSGSDPVCQKVRCTDPLLIENGMNCFE